MFQIAAILTLKNILHLDLKPDQFLYRFFASKDGKQEIVLSDFGFAVKKSPSAADVGSSILTKFIGAGFTRPRYGCDFKEAEQLNFAFFNSWQLGMDLMQHHTLIINNASDEIFVLAGFPGLDELNDLVVTHCKRYLQEKTSIDEWQKNVEKLRVKQIFI